MPDFHAVMYRFHYGADVEFVCVDTSRKSRLFSDRFFEQRTESCPSSSPSTRRAPKHRPRSSSTANKPVLWHTSCPDSVIQDIAHQNRTHG